MGDSFHTSYTVLKGNSGISKIKGTSLWNFVPNYGLRENFALAYPALIHIINLARQIRCSECDKPHHRRSTKLPIPLSSDNKPLVYHSSHQALSTARFCSADLLAKADTCVYLLQKHQSHNELTPKLLFLTEVSATYE